jgi:hypothetical protein
MEDLHNVLAQAGHRISESRIPRITKAGGFRWRKAKTVLTSNDPQYQSKLDAIKGILSELKPDEAFFSIDEYGPFEQLNCARKGAIHRIVQIRKRSAHRLQSRVIGMFTVCTA